MCIHTAGKLKSLPDHRGNRTRDLWTSILKVAVSIPTVVRQTFQQLARCECTLRVTPQTSYSPEYITPTHTKRITKREEHIIDLFCGKHHRHIWHVCSNLHQNKRMQCYTRRFLLEFAITDTDCCSKIPQIRS